MERVASVDVKSQVFTERAGRIPSRPKPQAKARNQDVHLVATKREVEMCGRIEC